MYVLQRERGTGRRGRQQRMGLQEHKATVSTLDAAMTGTYHVVLLSKPLLHGLVHRELDHGMGRAEERCPKPLPKGQNTLTAHNLAEGVCRAPDHDDRCRENMRQ